MARCIWALDKGDIVDRMITSTEPRAKHWIFALMDAFSHVEFVRMESHSGLFGLHAGNFIHEGITQSPLFIHLFI